MKKWFSNNKYDIITYSCLFIFYETLFMYLNTDFTDWYFWILTATLFIIKQVSFKNGKRFGFDTCIDNILNAETNCYITHKQQTIFLLKELSIGDTFSVVNECEEIQEPLDKYIKINDTSVGVLAFNICKKDTKIFNANDKVILYKHISLCTPIFKDNT